MRRARLYADENFPIRVVEILRDHGHDVLTTNEANKSNQGIDDPDVLRFAVSTERAVLTLNRRDFARLHSLSDRDHFGIVVCTYRNDPEDLAERLHQALLSCPELRGNLLRVCRPS